jgi:hypothetical protein
MNPSLRNTLLIFVDMLLGFWIIFVLPFAWILRDGLGPDSVTTTGITALSRTFMTFYAGPATLLFVSFDLLLRRLGNSDRTTSPKASMISWVAAIVGISAFSLIFVQIIFRS